MPPNVSFLTVSSAAMIWVCEEVGGRLAVFATVAKTVPAAHPMVAVAPNEALVVRSGEYLLKAACRALTAVMRSPTQRPPGVCPPAPLTPDCPSHGVVFPPAVDT